MLIIKLSVRYNVTLIQASFHFSPRKITRVISEYVIVMTCTLNAYVTLNIFLRNFNREKCYIMRVQDPLEKTNSDRSLMLYSVTCEINDTIYENMIRLNAKLEYYFAIDIAIKI